MSTVVAQPYSTAGNGGRKLVSLSNGWLVAVVEYDNYYSKAYISKDNGATWEFYGDVEESLSEVSVASNGTMVYIFGTRYKGNFRIHRFDATSAPSVIPSISVIGNNVVETGATSLAIDPTNGHLHAALSTKNVTYPNSFNILYSKSTDGGSTWSAVEQVTTLNMTGGYNFNSPSLVIRSGYPYILVDLNDGASDSDIFVFTKAFTTKLNRYTKSDWGNTRVYQGDFDQSTPSAVVDKDGVIHVAWRGRGRTWVIMYSKSIDGGITWSSERIISENLDNTSSVPSITVDKENNLFVLYDHYRSGRDTYLVKSIDSGNNWSNPVNLVDGGYNSSTLYDPTFSGVFGDRPPLIYQTYMRVEYIGTYTTNNVPTLTLNTTDNRTLYESDTFTIGGSAQDVDSGNVATVKYQINSGEVRAITVKISDGATFPFNRVLTFKQGKLYNGDTAVTNNLAEGSQHVLKVWVEDDQGGKSEEEVRSFYVVPNRPATLTIDNFSTRTDLIDSDAVTISGSVSDPDNNNVIVKYKIENGSFTEVYNGSSGSFSFQITLEQLNVGDNSITVQAVDSYGSITSKTLAVTKNENNQPLLTSVARYKLTPPNGTASGAVLWIQRETGDLVVDAEIHMGMNGDPESYQPMTLESTAFVTDGIEEDEFTFDNGGVEAENIILKLTMTRTSVTSDKGIKQISGVLS
ncbi:exo-alpha-sialidase [Gracilibacillus oryzae]|uniref:Exo-alpha-sialidase n=1 Tax=Gracilibacillus oryzae TaxID=1672701 RepID=A0A7C8GRB7_9BACI|nr:glycoside hydrolase [Gracilibacillus oryzae]KAB8126892.1 exo-alpha-sialidase [Gracilibacillus oryzae]